MNRQQRRTLEKKVGKKGMEELTEKVFEFSKLPQRCTTCNEAFDKKDRAMVQSWKVVIRQEAIRLFCPGCITIAKETIDECG